MSDRELVVVARAGLARGRQDTTFAVQRIVAAEEFAAPRELAAAAEIESRHVLWLPAFAELTPGVAARVTAWLASADASPRVAHAAVRLRCGATTIPLRARQLVLSSPGAVDLIGDTPHARPGVRDGDLGEPWEVSLPADLNAHLEAVNLQTSAAARLRHAAGERTSWRSLTLAPLGIFARGLGGVRGSRREAVPRLVIEAYREVLVAAKLWELAHGPALA